MPCSRGNALSDGAASLFGARMYRKVRGWNARRGRRNREAIMREYYRRDEWMWVGETFRDERGRKVCKFNLRE